MEELVLQAEDVSRIVHRGSDMMPLLAVPLASAPEDTWIVRPVAFDVRPWQFVRVVLLPQYDNGEGDISPAIGMKISRVSGA